MDKLISVVMATYNGEKFLKEQLESLLNQTYKNLEIIICDDCSNDKTIEIIEIYQKKDTRIKLYQNKENLGVLKNFEKAIFLSQGDYIAISDQDDIWKLDKIEILINSIGDSLLIYHDDYLMDKNGKIISHSFFNSNEIKIDIHHNIKSILLDNWILGHACMFSAELKKYILPIDIRVEHYDMWIAIVAIQFGTIRFMDKSLVYWRQHGDNSSGNKLENRNLFQKVFIPIDTNTYLQWNKKRIERLEFFNNVDFLSSYKYFVNDAINYYSLEYRFKAFIFSLKNINYIIQKKGILRKIKYIFLPLVAPKVDKNC